MRKLIVSEFVTLDGVMEDPGGAEGFDRGGWAFKFERGPDGDAFKADEVFGSDALLLGRRTYEGFAAAWPETAGALVRYFDHHADRLLLVTPPVSMVAPENSR